MSKMSELSAVLDALIECGNKLTETAEQLRSSFSQGENAYSADEPPQKPEESTPTKAVSLEEVRAVLAEKSRAGKTAAVKELLRKHGADKLSDIDPSEFAALLADAEVL